MRRSPAEVWQPQLTGPAAVHPHGIFFQAAVAKPPQPQPFHRALLSPDNLSSRTRAEPPTPQHTMCECRRPQVDGAGDVAVATEEHRRVPPAIGFETRKGRALDGLGPGQDTAGRDLLLQPVAEPRIDLCLDVVLRRVGLEGLKELTLGAHEPAIE